MTDFPGLEELRRRFDERLKSLNAEGAADRLRGLMASHARKIREAEFDSGSGLQESLNVTEHIDQQAAELRRARWYSKHSEPHFSILNRADLLYDTNLGVEVFARSFRYASWSQLLRFERAGIGADFFADMSERMGLQPTSEARQLLVKAGSDRDSADEGSAEAGKSGRLAISLVRIINRAVDLCPDPPVNPDSKADPWAFIGILIDCPQRTLDQTRLVGHMSLLTGEDLLNAAFDEYFGDLSAPRSFDQPWNHS